MNFSIIQKSQLEGAHRLDAEYYRPEYLEIENSLRHYPTEKIVDLTAFVKKGVFDLSPENYRIEGVPFVRVQNIKSGFLDEENLVYIPGDVHRKEKKTELNSFDIVLSKVGTVGEVSIIPSHFSQANFSQNVIGLKIRRDKIPKGFLLLFLLSKFGQLQIARANMLQVQPKLELKDIRDLLVTRLGDEENYFDDQVHKIEDYIENSKTFYSQAENMLLEDLGLMDKKFDEDLATMVKFSEIKSAGRMDADYFQPKYQKILSLIRANRGIELGELATVKKGIEPGAEAYQDEGRLFIRVSSLSKFGITDKDEKYLNEKLYETLKINYQPKVGEVLLTKDASPGVAYALKENIEGIISGGILRLKMKEDMDPEYLVLCINSVVGQAQVERDAGGSIIRHWKPEQVKQMLIPIVSKPIQQKIADLVRQSHEARKKSKQLLEGAKHKVEKMIEENRTS